VGTEEREGGNTTARVHLGPCTHRPKNGGQKHCSSMWDLIYVYTTPRQVNKGIHLGQSSKVLFGKNANFSTVEFQNTRGAQRNDQNTLSAQAVA